jgi:Membrane domain of glycerophosphoryl diester phosphodiesterase
VTSLDLRPLSTGELLDRSFALYRNHPLLFIGIMAVPAVLSLVIGLPFAIFTHVNPMPTGPDARIEDVMPVLIGMMVFGCLFLTVYSMVYMLALGATTLAVSEIYVDRVPTIGGSYARVRHLFGRLMWLATLAALRLGGIGVAIVGVAGIVAALLVPLARQTPLVGALMALVIMVGMLAAFIITVWLSLRYAVIVPALVLEQVSAAESIRRSVHLTKGYLGRVLLLLLCVMVLTYVSALIFQMPFTVAAVFAGPESTAALWFTIIGTISSSIGSTLTAPVMIIGFAVLYYDLRIRKEALDLDMMIQALDTGSDGVSMTAPAVPVLPD